MPVDLTGDGRANGWGVDTTGDGRANQLVHPNQLARPQLQPNQFTQPQINWSQQPPQQQFVQPMSPGFGSGFGNASMLGSQVLLGSQVALPGARELLSASSD